MVVSIAELRTLKAFDRFSDEQLGSIIPLMRRQAYSPGELIFLEGEPSQGIWFILQGRVRIVKQSMQGRVQALCISNRGKCFGGCPLFDEALNPANAQALDDVVLCFLPNDVIEQHADMSILWTMLEVYSQRIDHLSHLAQSLSGTPVFARINEYLATHHEHGVVNLTQEKLAETIGSVREVVSRHLTCLEKEGLIQIEPGRITVLEPKSLRCGCIALDVT
ncbi:MAG: Crp/Fnr family transcriptional regulator [Anaerolineales bacterium]|nr:Crp/Fnr family transcriptional regulator [Anaerolineales bacterium]